MISTVIDFNFASINIPCLLVLGIIVAYILILRQSPTALDDVSNWCISRRAGLLAYREAFKDKRYVNAGTVPGLSSGSVKVNDTESVTA